MYVIRKGRVGEMYPLTVYDRELLVRQITIIVQIRVFPLQLLEKLVRKERG
jgi:hypothetical protein